MASHSAFVGQLPNNEDDLLIVKAWFVFLGINGKKDPAQGFQPPMKAPPGHVYPGENKQALFYGYASFALFLMVFATGSRLAIRIRMFRLQVGWDDWFIVLGTLFACCVPIGIIVTTKHGGVGKHIYDNTYSEYAFFYSTFNMRTIFLYMALPVIKMSIILFYMRLNGFTSRRWMATHWTLFGICAAFFVCGACLNIFNCPDISAKWNFRLHAYLDKRQKCLDQLSVIIGLNVVNILTDAALLIVPIAMLWKVQMRWTTKLRIWLVGIVGIANIVLSVVRTTANLTTGKDVTWNYAYLNAWSMCEITLGVITASLPILSIPVINFFRKHIRPLLRTPSTTSPAQPALGQKSQPHHLNGKNAFSRLGCKWPGGRPRPEDEMDEGGISLGGMTTVYSDTFEGRSQDGLGSGNGAATKRWKEEGGGAEDEDILPLDERKQASYDHQRHWSETGSQYTDVEKGEGGKKDGKGEGTVVYDDVKGNFVVMGKAI